MGSSPREVSGRPAGRPSVDWNISMSNFSPSEGKKGKKRRKKEGGRGKLLLFSFFATAD